MTFDTGTLIAVAAALLFYLRLIILQRQKVKQARARANEASLQKGKKKSGAAEPPHNYAQYGFQVVSWYLVGAGVALILFGAVLAGAPWFGDTLKNLWWAFLTVGIAVLGFSVR